MPELGVIRHGWQFGAAQKVDDCFLSGLLWPGLSLPSRALLRLQGGSLAGLPFTCFPTAAHSQFVMKVVLMNLYFTCAVSGVLGRRGFAVESAAARVCREAGARVSPNVRVQDMDLARPSASDNRRLEIVADGLPLFHGAQSAVETAVVSVLTRDGRPQCHHGRCSSRNISATERDNVSQAEWPIREDKARGLGGRGRREVVRRVQQFNQPVGQQSPCPTGVALEVGHGVGMQCGSRSGFIVARKTVRSRFRRRHSFHVLVFELPAFNLNLPLFFHPCSAGALSQSHHRMRVGATKQLVSRL